MNLKKEIIYNYLSACNQSVGGYTGRDIGVISKILELNRKTVKRYIENWSKKEPRFAELKYFGPHLITVTLEDIEILNQLLSENITIRKQEIIREINDKRIKRGDTAISQSKLYENIRLVAK